MNTSILPFISVICPVYNEEKYIANCIESVLRQDYPTKHVEVFFVDGGSTDRTREIIMLYQEQFPYLQLMDNPNKTSPYAMNLGIRLARGEYIVRLDGHSVYPENYFSQLIHYAIELQADNVGGEIITLPASDTVKCKAIAIALSHRFGVGNSMFRVGTTKIIRTDTVPFGCYKKDIFAKIGLYDEELTRNQDDELNARLIKHGGKIFLVPNLGILYTVRDTLRKMCKMYYQYGLFKPLVNKKIKRFVSVRQFVPALFLCGLLAGAILSCFFYPVFLLYVAIIALYFLTGICIGIQQIKSREEIGFVMVLPATFFLIHVSYGWGFLVGLYKILTRSKFRATENR
ncbi:MAG: glycosyltransferase family 2 protein [Bacteroidales bacterium]|jgi:glycosyltransferase involved in cell wall biosynthesis|nr:glycosyltransferase family 2 protein [Bacteroidales bacterium]